MSGIGASISSPRSGRRWPSGRMRVRARATAYTGPHPPCGHPLPLAGEGIRPLAHDADFQASWVESSYRSEARYSSKSAACWAVRLAEQEIGHQRLLLRSRAPRRPRPRPGSACSGRRGARSPSRPARRAGPNGRGRISSRGGTRCTSGRRTGTARGSAGAARGGDTSRRSCSGRARARRRRRRGGGSSCS